LATEVAFLGGRDTGRCCLNNTFRCPPYNVARESAGRERTASGASGFRPLASHRPRRLGLIASPSGDGARQPRWAFSSLRCRPSRPCIRLHRSEQAKTLSRTRSQIVQIQNEAIGLRQTEQLCAPGMFSHPQS